MSITDAHWPANPKPYGIYCVYIFRSLARPPPPMCIITVISTPTTVFQRCCLKITLCSFYHRFFRSSKNFTLVLGLNKKHTIHHDAKTLKTRVSDVNLCPVIGSPCYPFLPLGISHNILDFAVIPTHHSNPLGQECRWRFKHSQPSLQSTGCRQNGMQRQIVKITQVGGDTYDILYVLFSPPMIICHLGSTVVLSHHVTLLVCLSCISQAKTAQLVSW